jgi:hypothetical protein
MEQLKQRDKPPKTKWKFCPKRVLNPNFCSWTSWRKSLVHVFMNGSWTCSNFSHGFFFLVNMFMNKTHCSWTVHEHVQISGQNLNKTWTSWIWTSSWTCSWTKLEQVEFEQVSCHQIACSPSLRICMPWLGMLPMTLHLSDFISRFMTHICWKTVLRFIKFLIVESADVYGVMPFAQCVHIFQDIKHSFCFLTVLWPFSVTLFSAIKWYSQELNQCSLPKCWMN